MAELTATERVLLALCVLAGALGIVVGYASPSAGTNILKDDGRGRRAHGGRRGGVRRRGSVTGMCPGGALQGCHGWVILRV